MKAKFLGLLFSFCYASFSWSQTATVPGLQPGQALEDKIKQEQRTRKKQSLQSETPSAQQPAAEDLEQVEDAGPRFELKTVQFSKSAYLSRDDLIGVLKAYLGQQVSYADLQRLLDDINSLYREKGIYTATALLPQQQIKQGVVNITLVEGKLENILFEGNEYTEDDEIRAWISHQDSDQVLNSQQLEDELLVYNRINQQRLRAELQAGESFGATNIVIQVDEPDRDYLEIFADNWGYESSGEDEIGLLYQRQKLFFAGDRALAYVLASEGTQAASFGLNAPIATSKWRVGSTLSYTQTQVVGEEFEVLDTQGESLRFSIDASHLSYSAETFWVNSLATVAFTQSETELESIEGLGQTGKIADSDTLQLQAGVEINWLGDNWQVNARELINYAQFDDTLDSDDDQQFVALLSDLDWLYRLDYGFYLQQQLSFQYTDKEGLKGALSFTSGGPSTVRGYDNGAISGDTGIYQQFELHNNWLSNPHFYMDWFVFYDHALDRTVKQFEINSVGVGLNVADGRWVNLSVTAGQTLKDVLPDQEQWGVNVRLSCTCLP